MTIHVRALATHLPVWGTARGRVAGPDEDAVTLAVAAGRSALAAAAAGGPDGTGDLRHVVLVTRDLPLLEGGSTAVLLAGLDLPDSVRVTEVLGGAPAVFDALAGATPGTLVIGADAAGAAGAGAALTGTSGAEVRLLARRDRSLPVHTRDDHGNVAEYADARLLRERGVLAGLAALDLPGKPLAVAGLQGKDAASLTGGALPAPPTLGASSALFALAGALEPGAAGHGDIVLAVEQATLAALSVEPGPVALAAHAPEPRPLPKRAVSAEAEIKISLAAYERAFDAKLRLRAGRCPACGELALPPRTRCLACGSNGPHELVPLPREAEVYTAVTVHVPVPGLATPYSLAIAELGDTGVRLLAHVTDAPPDTVAIGDHGTLVLRRIAIRSGVPDYGYAFAPATADAGGTGHAETREAV